MPLSRTFLLLLFLFCQGLLWAQPSDAGADQLYRQAVGFNQRLYNGTEYIRTYYNIAGHPFLEQDSLTNGSIRFDGITYDGVPLNYDLARQEVITKGVQIFLIRLVPEKIESFRLHGRNFRRYDTILGGKQLKGIYEELYSGSSRVLAFHEKQVKQATQSDEQGKFLYKTSFYVVRKGVVSPVRNRSDLFDLFASRREDLRNVLKAQQIDFRTHPAAALVAAARLEDQNQH